jgi:DMSO reductase family type II enzyme heme b subunit
MVRSLHTDNERDAQLTPGASAPVAFSIWDGAQGDRDGRKAVTVWQRLTLQSKP